jgi:CRP/FNR family transcriptional regulator
LQLSCYSRRRFDHLLAEHANLEQLFLERTLDVVDPARDWMLLLGCKNAPENLAALLLI